jgi:hypothetical protein
MTRSLAEVSSPEAAVGACVDDPERWITTIDEQAKAVCLNCPRRWLCAREACEMPRAAGIGPASSFPKPGAGAPTRFAGCVHWPSGVAIRSASRRGDRPDGGGLAGTGRAKNPGNVLGKVIRYRRGRAA